MRKREFPASFSLPGIAPKYCEAPEIARVDGTRATLCRGADLSLGVSGGIMAAHHWEARRKQNLLDRRLMLQMREAYERKQQDEAAGKVPPKQSSPLCPNTESQNSALLQGQKGLTLESSHRKDKGAEAKTECDMSLKTNSSHRGATESHCPCKTEHVPNHSGKLLKRYSDFEYIQQW